jgi:hypothetical protein
MAHEREKFKLPPLLLDKFMDMPVDKILEEILGTIARIDANIRALDQILSKPLPGASAVRSDRDRDDIYRRFDYKILLRMFIDNGDTKALVEATEKIMREVNCSFCRAMISAAYMEAKFGNMQKAKEYAINVYNFLVEQEKESIKEKEKEEEKKEEKI